MPGAKGRSGGKPTDWVSIEGEYRAGAKSVRAIADAYRVSEAAIRKRAKAMGWSRDPTGTKRQIVKAAMAGGTHAGTQCAMRTIEDAAAQDVADLERGLRIQRHCLIALEVAAESVKEPREVKIIVDATGAAIDTIRKIRGLEEPQGTNKESDPDDEARAESIAGRLESRITEATT